MRLRAVILDDEPITRQLLWTLCDRRGYEVLTFPDPGLCPLHVMHRCPCPQGTVCADLLLCGLHLPEEAGLDFAEGLLRRGCVAPHLALLAGGWSEAAWARAVRLGCRLFRKPFSSAEILGWFDIVETQVDPTRDLLDWRGQGWRIARPARGG